MQALELTSHFSGSMLSRYHRGRIRNCRRATDKGENGPTHASATLSLADRPSDRTAGRVLVNSRREYGRRQLRAITRNHSASSR